MAVHVMWEIPEGVQEILRTLEAAGYEAWCVGGCVRDMLANREPEDWDVAASALPEETMAVFEGRAAPTGLKHGTVTVRTGDRPVEITTYGLTGSIATTAGRRRCRLPAAWRRISHGGTLRSTPWR